jgi:hypothetical protein
MHAIVTLHGLIETGEILRRREATGAGAQVTVEQRDGQAVEVPVRGTFTLGDG